MRADATWLSPRIECSLFHERIRARWAERLEGRVGLDALRELVLDNLPLDEERALESRLEMSYWPRALSNQDVLDIGGRDAAELHGLLRSLVRAAQERSELPHTETTETTELLMALIDGLSLHGLLFPTLVSIKLQTDIVDRVFGHLIADR